MGPVLSFLSPCCHTSFQESLSTIRCTDYKILRLAVDVGFVFHVFRLVKANAPMHTGILETYALLHSRDPIHSIDAQFFTLSFSHRMWLRHS